MPITPGKWIADSSVYRPDRYYRYAELTELLTGKSSFNRPQAIRCLATTGSSREWWSQFVFQSPAGDSLSCDLD